MVQENADICPIRAELSMKSGHIHQGAHYVTHLGRPLRRLIMAYGNISAIGRCTLGTNVTMPNNVALMDDNNIIMLCDDMTLTGTHTANDILLTLPDPAMFPSTPLRLLGLCQQTGGNHLTRVFFIDTQGNLRCNIPVAGVYYLNGFMWHNNGKYYSNKVNASSQTTPLNLR